MGEHADDILNGDVDEQTGEWLGNGQGFPRSIHKRSEPKPDEQIMLPIQKILVDNGYTITLVKKINYGFQIKTASGVIVNIYSSGKVCLQGKLDEKLKQLIK